MGGGDPELLEKLMKEGEDEQKRRLDSRRELLRQRKALKKQSELEQKKLQEQLEIMKLEDEEKSKIGKNYIKDLFQQTRGKDHSSADAIADEKAKQQERLVVFNEFASDAMLARLSNLLMKQFVEREAALKLLV